MPFYFFGGGLALGTATIKQFDSISSDRKDDDWFTISLFPVLYSNQEETQTNLGYYLEAGYKIPFNLVLISLTLNYTHVLFDFDSNYFKGGNGFDGFRLLFSLNWLI